MVWIYAWKYVCYGNISLNFTGNFIHCTEDNLFTLVGNFTCISFAVICYMLPREGHMYCCLLKSSLAMQATTTMVLAVHKDENRTSSTKVLDHSSDYVQSSRHVVAWRSPTWFFRVRTDPCDLLLEVILPLEVIYWLQDQSWWINVLIIESK